jgi:hypothetical protein
LLFDPIERSEIDPSVQLVQDGRRVLGTKVVGEQWCVGLYERHDDGRTRSVWMLVVVAVMD